MLQVEIIAGDHEPNLPFVIVDRRGIHVSLTGIGQLWDGNTMAKLRWGLLDNQGNEFGRINFKDGGVRNFFDRDLLLPYLKVFTAAWTAMEASTIRARAQQDADTAAAIQAIATTRPAVAVRLAEARANRGTPPPVQAMVAKPPSFRP